MHVRNMPLIFFRHSKIYQVYHNVFSITRSFHFQGHPKIYQAFIELLGIKPIDCMNEYLFCHPYKLRDSLLCTLHELCFFSVPYLYVNCIETSIIQQC